MEEQRTEVEEKERKKTAKELQEEKEEAERFREEAFAREERKHALLGVIKTLAEKRCFRNQQCLRRAITDRVFAFSEKDRLEREKIRQRCKTLIMNAQIQKEEAIKAVTNAWKVETAKIIAGEEAELTALSLASKPLFLEAEKTLGEMLDAEEKSCTDFIDRMEAGTVESLESVVLQMKDGYLSYDFERPSETGTQPPAVQ